MTDPRRGAAMGVTINNEEDGGVDSVVIGFVGSVSPLPVASARQQSNSAMTREA